MFASFRRRHSCNERLQAWGTCFVSGMYKDTTAQKEAIMSGACVGWAHASLLCFVSIVCGITSGRKHEGKNTLSGAQDTEWLQCKQISAHRISLTNRSESILPEDSQFASQLDGTLLSRLFIRLKCCRQNEAISRFTHSEKEHAFFLKRVSDEIEINGKICYVSSYGLAFNGNRKNVLCIF